MADCIALFGMQKYDTFPVDVWVKRVMEEFYVEDNLSLPKIRKFALDKFGRFIRICTTILILLCKGTWNR